MLNNKINSQINKKKSFLCVGLDIDIKRIPKSLLDYDDPIFEFAKQIIDSTINMLLHTNLILLSLKLTVLMVINLLKRFLNI